MVSCKILRMSDSVEILSPLAPRALLRRLDSPATASSPYVVPDSAKERGTECEVVAIPDPPVYVTEWGIRLLCPVKVGDRVLVGKYAGDYRFRNEDVTLVRWDEILAVIADEKNDKNEKEELIP